ncbi:hypothetical protein E1292_14300 [Nonomuraea deserti]|uniref:Transposase IS4-like domain-containing protein n=1 Tax=Nonomuraea deserti TaxID=1848322 RepID=A0A4V2YBB4_9ACTN|nr:hypothetical protein [Nonomuraea deserti]TDD06976.1 hypothetical protein E1292_14300 [Nonomuraea deserti]
MKGFRSRGKSKDHRDDLPQIVIGMAVTRDGIPVRIWSWPGNTTDTALIRQVKDDMRDWTLSKIGGSVIAASPPPTTAATCAKAITTTSSANGCVRARPRPRARCPARAATRTWPRI